MEGIGARLRAWLGWTSRAPGTPGMALVVRTTLPATPRSIPFIPFTPVSSAISESEYCPAGRPASAPYTPEAGVFTFRIWVVDQGEHVAASNAVTVARG